MHITSYGKLDGTPSYQDPNIAQDFLCNINQSCLNQALPAVHSNAPQMFELAM